MMMIFELLGGLGVFLFGMRIMSTGLQKVAGSRLRELLALCTRNRFTGIVSGFLMTCSVQSSSATTVMIVSFANAGLLTLQQAIGPVMGANRTPDNDGRGAGHGREDQERHRTP